MNNRYLHSEEESLKQDRNLAVLHDELHWLEQVITQVIGSYLKHEGHENHWTDIPFPDLTESTAVYGNIINQWNLTIYDRVALALAIAPHIRPEILDTFLGLNGTYQRQFTEFGGVVDKGVLGFLPTGQTLNFLISGNDPLWRNITMDILHPEHPLMAEQVLELNHSEENLPYLSGVLGISQQWLHYLITGEQVHPELSSSFPAHPLSTTLQWDDLVLEESVMEQIEEIKAWLTHGNTLMTQWNLQKKIRPGYRTLFYGPPGTGKTLTASLLAQSTGREIYRVDLSMIVSKYIGETEKNLSKVFDAAAYKEWILFFDEADSLFGKRTAATTSNDRHANQQTGYLLQKIEDFPGVVILATNLKTNMDEAFTRRFQNIIEFTIPTVDERLTLWENAFRDVCTLSDDINFYEIADKYELAGGAIINVLRYCALNAVSRQDKIIYSDDIIHGIRREFRKDSRTI